MLTAGAATVPVPPPLGVDMVGYLRRWQPATGYGEPVEANALVLDDGSRRLALVALDFLATPGEYGQRMREAIAAKASADPGSVLVNCSHTHAAPPPPGMLKIGGSTHELREDEARYAEALIDLAASAAALAASRLEPVRVGAARTSIELGVNRRQRVADGPTILGWNPDAPCDRDVAVLRIDRLDGTALTTVVAYGCHPVVLGWDVAEVSSDFVGPLRARVRAWTGGDCMFLQGCGGNVLPLEAFWSDRGPEREFGDRLALAALAGRDLAETVRTEPRQQATASAVPIAVWRREPTGEELPTEIAAAETTIDLPLQEPPSADGIRTLRRELEERVESLRREGAGREQWNPPWIHEAWAEAVERRVADGTVEHSVEARVQALRIGHVGIVALPCEPFSELGIAVKGTAKAPFPVVLGYSNDMIGYVPTREEFPFGGYEPALSHRHFGRASPLQPGAGELLVERAVKLLDALFMKESEA